MPAAEVIVAGAGPAGLAAAAEAHRRGLLVEVLEAAPSVGASWRQHYDRLHLHTTRRLSSLPGRPIPNRMGRWVGRDDFIVYLNDYARQAGLDISFGTRVERIERSPAGWCLQTSQGLLETPQVVVATG
ncbi:MAG TPA: NAD(P)-binding domain-containing protein, partial [Candidatus Acidoferrales bacterium]|nr:NAD(P)-binding domain-containing protein [Candidatus Acidoferrales bacterium]